MLFYSCFYFLTSCFYNVFVGFMAKKTFFLEFSQKKVLLCLDIPIFIIFVHH